MRPADKGISRNHGLTRGMGGRTIIGSTILSTITTRNILLTRVRGADSPTEVSRVLFGTTTPTTGGIISPGPLQEEAEETTSDTF